MPIFVRTIIFSILVPGTVTVFIPQLLIRNVNNPLPIDLDWIAYGGILLILPGIWIYLRCAADFSFKGKGTPLPTDPPIKLIENGLYKFSRNPMYVGILLILFGEAILMESLLILLFTLFMFLVFQSFIVLYEEPHLRSRFGSGYIDYCKRVNRWTGRSVR